MFECDVVIIGGGPAGLTAGLYLSRAKRNVILLEKEVIGGPIMNYELIKNYPGFANGISGAQLASEMVNQATKYGIKLELAEVEGIKDYKKAAAESIDIQSVSYPLAKTKKPLTILHNQGLIYVQKVVAGVGFEPTTFGL